MRSLCLFLLLLCASHRTAGAVEVDLQLVLAVDVSESVDRDELAVQRAGYVAALRHPDLVRAMLSGRHRRVALAYFEWAATPRPESFVAWRVIDEPADALAFADELASRPVAVFRGTSISRAVDHAAELFDDGPGEGGRRVIDISGDGPNNLGRPVTQARDDAIGRGVTINGLPLLIRPSPIFPAMDRYYAACVVGGAGAFVLPASGLADFGQAIREKLLLEISQAAPLPLVPAAAAEAVDCLVGETVRRQAVGTYFPELEP